MTAFLISLSISLTCWALLLHLVRARKMRRLDGRITPAVHPAIKAYWNGDISTIEEMEDYLDGRRTWPKPGDRDFPFSGPVFPTKRQPQLDCPDCHGVGVIRHSEGDQRSMWPCRRCGTNEADVRYDTRGLPCEHRTLDWIYVGVSHLPVEGICTECGRSWPYSECPTAAPEAIGVRLAEHEDRPGELHARFLPRMEFEAAREEAKRQIDELNRRAGIEWD